MGYSQLDQPTFDKYRLVKENTSESQENTPKTDFNNQMVNLSDYALKSDIDALTHAIKSIKTTMAMMEADSDHSYARGRGSYARGRNARRDSMGRYSREQGYSMANDGMIMELRELMQDAPDERTRMEFQKFIRKIEQM